MEASLTAILLRPGNP